MWKELEKNRPNRATDFFHCCRLCFCWYFIYIVFILFNIYCFFWVWVFFYCYCCCCYLPSFLVKHAITLAIWCVCVCNKLCTHIDNEYMMSMLCVFKFRYEKQRKKPTTTTTPEHTSTLQWWVRAHIKIHSHKHISTQLSGE